MNPTSENTTERIALIDQLKTFLMTAPDGQQESIKQYTLSPTTEIISCVKWNDAFYISGTDIVRSMVYRFQAFGRPIKNIKKFEEGVFSDLRNLRPGFDAILEEPKSPFLDLLFQHNCIRTQKKQKVFYWYSVPHDRLFLDALERDLKREKMGIDPTSVPVAQPAINISLDTTQAMFDNFRKSILSELDLGPFYHPSESDDSSSTTTATDDDDDSCSVISNSPDTTVVSNLGVSSPRNVKSDLKKVSSTSSTIFGQFSLFDGSPSYKQRRRRVTLNTQQKQQQIKQENLENNTTTLDIHENNNKRIKSFSPPTLCESSPKHSSSVDDSNNSSSTTTWRSNDLLSSSSNNNTDDDISGNGGGDDSVSGSTDRHYDCPLATCDKYFKRLEHMKRHLRTHTMERPYMCDRCGKRFSRSDNLAQHIKTHDRNKTKRSIGVHQSPRSQRVTKKSNNNSSGSDASNVKSSARKNSSGGYLSKSINTSFPGRQRNNESNGNRIDTTSSSSYGSTSRSFHRGGITATSLRGLSLTATSPSTSRVASRSRVLRRSADQRRQQLHRPRRSRVTSNSNVVETEVMYESSLDWPQHYESIEFLKTEPALHQQQEQLLLQPELSISTTSSSSTSSCNTSPTCTTRPPVIKVEEVEPYYDFHIQQQHQMNDTAMMMVEELMPQQEHQYYCWEDESASDWQRRVDWNQYSSPRTTTVAAENINLEPEEDSLMENYHDQQQEYLLASSFANYYYLNQASSHYNNHYYDVSNSSSCLASPTLVPSFLIETAATSTSNSTATTVANSPIMRASEFHPSPLYFSDESPTITPSDALLYRH